MQLACNMHNADNALFVCITLDFYWNCSFKPKGINLRHNVCLNKCFEVLSFSFTFSLLCFLFSHLLLWPLHPCVFTGTAEGPTLHWAEAQESPWPGLWWPAGWIYEGCDRQVWSYRPSSHDLPISCMRSAIVIITETAHGALKRNVLSSLAWSVHAVWCSQMFLDSEMWNLTHWWFNFSFFELKFGC